MNTIVICIFDVRLFNGNTGCYWLLIVIYNNVPSKLYLLPGVIGITASVTVVVNVWVCVKNSSPY